MEDKTLPKIVKFKHLRNPFGTNQIDAVYAMSDSIDM